MPPSYLKVQYQQKTPKQNLRDRSLTSNHPLLYATPTLLFLKSHSRNALLSLFRITPTSSIEAQLTRLMNSKVVRHSKPCICLSRWQFLKFKCTNDFIGIKDGISMRQQQPYRSRCFKHFGNASIIRKSVQYSICMQSKDFGFPRLWGMQDNFSIRCMQRVCKAVNAPKNCITVVG